MLGRILEWNQSQAVDVPAAGARIVLHGVHVQVQVDEKDNSLRLDKLDRVSNDQEDQQGEQLMEWANLLKHRHSDLEHTARELKELKARMEGTDDEDEQDALYVDWKAKNAVKKKHQQEIARLEGQLSLTVDFQVSTEGVFDVIPANQTVFVDFLPHAVCWCPARPPSRPFRHVENKTEQMPLRPDRAEVEWCRAHFQNKPRELQEAKVRQYRLFADAGDAVGQYLLGYCYFNGHGVAQDDKQAVAWVQQSADQGNADAQFDLGDCYYCGRGVAQDYKQAVAWYQKSADQGHAPAQRNLNRLLLARPELA